MVLKPQDLLILLKMVAMGRQGWSYNSLALSLAMSPAEVHAGVKRAAAAGLAVFGGINAPARPVLKALEEFVLHGAPYVFIAERQGLVRGVPTAWGHGEIREGLLADGLPPVWPHPDGEARGEGISPLYKSAPQAALNDPALYQLLALFDLLRIGRAREKQIARKELAKHLTGSDTYENGAAY